MRLDLNISINLELDLEVNKCEFGKKGGAASNKAAPRRINYRDKT
jgi:hypothetical protein